MSNLDEITDLWVLRAKVKAYESALAEAIVERREANEAAINLAEEVHLLKEGVRGFAVTLRQWARAAGGHTPSAIVASKLLQLIGDEPAPQPTEASVAMGIDEP